MENLIIESTQSTPFIRFDSTRRTMEIKGESYPENAAGFYEPVLKWLEIFMEKMDIDSTASMNIEMIYFNSSSSKALMNIFDMLEDSALEGKKVVVNWYFDKDNDAAQEYGEEFKEDVESITFNLVQLKEEV